MTSLSTQKKKPVVVWSLTCPVLCNGSQVADMHTSGTYVHSLTFYKILPDMYSDK